MATTKADAPLVPGSPELQHLWAPLDVAAYVDSASYGLPPKATIEALKEALQRWQAGTADWIEDWDRPAEEARVLGALILGCSPAELALLPAVSVGVATVATSLGADDEVVVPDDEFTSVLFPLLVAQGIRGFALRRVPFGAIADAVRPGTTLVATSHVRSNGGGRQDLAAVKEAADRYGAAVLLDATHSAGILTIGAEANDIDYVVCAAYKHLLCPRGVAFLRVAESHWPALQPHAASWRSARDPYGKFYGGTLEDLAENASRFDVSLAWHAWFGARESLRVLANVDAGAREAWTVSLASDLASKLAIPPTGSSVLGIPVTEETGALISRLRAASVVASIRQGSVRVSFHVYNDQDDVDLVAQTLAEVVDHTA